MKMFKPFKPFKSFKLFRRLDQNMAGYTKFCGSAQINELNRQTEREPDGPRRASTWACLPQQNLLVSPSHCLRVCISTVRRLEQLERFEQLESEVIHEQRL